MKSKEDYPIVLKATHIAEIMQVSRPTAYEYMKHSDFPLLEELEGVKRVLRDEFFKWLESKQRRTDNVRQLRRSI
jgi:predicted DNA-binding transcriptional regulator AlpA